MSWYNFHYNTGTGGGTIVLIKKAPFYAVRYIGESARRIFYRVPKKVRVSYIGESAKRIFYRAPKKVRIMYVENRRIKITLKVC